MKVLLKTSASTPRFLSWLTWSFIREIKGEMTIVNREHQRRDLVTNGLAPARRHNKQGIFFVQHRLDAGFLQRPEGVIAENGAKDV